MSKLKGKIHLFEESAFFMEHNFAINGPIVLQPHTCNLDTLLLFYKSALVFLYENSSEHQKRLFPILSSKICFSVVYQRLLIDSSAIEINHNKPKHLKQQFVLQQFHMSQHLQSLCTLHIQRYMYFICMLAYVIQLYRNKEYGYSPLSLTCILATLLSTIISISKPCFEHLSSYPLLY